MSSDSAGIVPHYAEAFWIRPGRCFRLIRDPVRLGQPADCPEPAVWRGGFIDGRGWWHTAEACAGHMHDLIDPTTSVRPAAWERGGSAEQDVPG